MFSGWSILLALQSWPALRGVDYWWFRGWLFWGGVSLLALTIVVQSFRIWAIWTRLRTLLMLLFVSPLADGFANVPEELASAKLWRSFETRQSHAPATTHFGRTSSNYQSRAARLPGFSPAIT